MRPFPNFFVTLPRKVKAERACPLRNGLSQDSNTLNTCSYGIFNE